MEIIDLIQPVKIGVVGVKKDYPGYLSISPEVIFQMTPNIKQSVKLFIEVSSFARKHKETGVLRVFCNYNITDWDEHYVYVNDVMVSNINNFRKSLAESGFENFAREVTEYSSIPKEVIYKAVEKFLKDDEQATVLFEGLDLWNTLTEEEKNNWGHVQE